VGLFRPFVAIVKKKTGFRRSELREETHEKACLTSIYDRNRDLIRAKPRRYHGRATALPSCMGDWGHWWRLAKWSNTATEQFQFDSTPPSGFRKFMNWSSLF